MSRCVGLDIHKHVVDACVLDAEGQVVLRSQPLLLLAAPSGTSRQLHSSGIEAVAAEPLDLTLEVGDSFASVQRVSNKRG